MSTPSQLYFGKGFFLCFATQILHPSGHSVAKKAGTAWEHWTSQIDDHLKPSTVAKRCTSLKSRKSPALRGFVAGRWALATTFLYPSTKIERPKRARNGAPGGVLLLELNVLDGQGRRVMTIPDSHRPTRGPMPPKCPCQVHRLHPCPQASTQSPHGRDGGLPVGVQFFCRSGCEPCPQMLHTAVYFWFKQPVMKHTETYSGGCPLYGRTASAIYSTNAKNQIWFATSNASQIAYMILETLRASPSR